MSQLDKMFSVSVIKYHKQVIYFQQADKSNSFQSIITNIYYNDNI